MKQRINKNFISKNLSQVPYLISYACIFNILPVIDMRGERVEFKVNIPIDVGTSLSSFHYFLYFNY